ncbi:hypothetical protein NUSPORA_00850 [Nucleospora cyclopteri]
MNIICLNLIFILTTFAFFHKLWLFKIIITKLLIKKVNKVFLIIFNPIIIFYSQYLLIT